jgi:hypothetical protein
MDIMDSKLEIGKYYQNSHPYSVNPNTVIQVLEQKGQNTFYVRGMSNSIGRDKNLISNDFEYYEEISEEEYLIYKIERDQCESKFTLTFT